MATVLCGRRRERPRSEPWWPQPALKPARATSAPCSAQSVPEHRRSPTHPLGNYYPPPRRHVFLASNQEVTPISNRYRGISSYQRDTSGATSREAVLVISSGTLLA